MSAVQDEAMRRARERERLKEANSAANREAALKTNMDNYLSNPSGGFSLYGTAEEKDNQAANLSQVGAMTGLSMFDLGQNSKNINTALNDRLSGTDAVSQYAIAGKGRQMANLGRSFAGRGIAGGVAASAMNQAQREADAGINAIMQENQRQNVADLDKFNARNQRATGNALATGKKEGAAQEMDVNAGEGITLICTELHRQGLLPLEVQAADHAFGVRMWDENFTTMLGYTTLAQPVVRKMKISKSFTKLVAQFAIPWAYHVAGKKNLVGFTVMFLGLPLCWTYGTYKILKCGTKPCL